VTDGVGRAVRLDAPPRRIVSLVPSTTETLFDLGLGERVVGRTRYCVHPADGVEALPTVGGTKNVDLDALQALEPDLVLGNQEENLPEIWPGLEAAAPLYVAYPRSVDDAREDLLRMAHLVGADGRGAALAARIDAGRAALRPEPFRFACLIWKTPWMAAGDDTYLSALLGEWGGVNVVEGRYPEVTLEQLQARAPDVVLLPSEPFPFAERHLPDLGELAPRARLLDGQLLTWHGSRLALALEQLPGGDAGWVPGR
jgi:ABC-type Fe3+-hydroxamate transport system substrate-binding protein